MPSVDVRSSRSTSVDERIVRASLAVPPSRPASAGMRTSARTIARSSTMSQPTAMRPRSLSSRCRSCSALSSTTVEATESARPKMSPPPSDQPSEQRETEAEPGRADDLHERAGDGDGADRQQVLAARNAVRRRTSGGSTPISVSSCARLWSATKPGVCGPTTTPATR